MTLEQLTALSDPELSVLAARKIHGWQVGFGTWEERGIFVRCHIYESAGGAVMPVHDYTPATNRNQSGELLRVMASRGAEFVQYLDKAPLIKVWAVFFAGDVPGNSARSETLAALMAAFALEDKPNA